MKNPLKFLDLIPKENDFQIQSVLACPKTPLRQNFHNYPISSFYVKLLTDKQTRQTKAR